MNELADGTSFGRGKWLVVRLLGGTGATTFQRPGESRSVPYDDGLIRSPPAPCRHAQLKIPSNWEHSSYSTVATSSYGNVPSRYGLVA